MIKNQLPDGSVGALEELQASVERLSARYEPDYLCEIPVSPDDAMFRVVDLNERQTALSGEEVALCLRGQDYLFSEWSRFQLLDHMGTREKWFKRVTLEEQARELNRRVHALDGQRIRRMQSLEDIGFVRGLVSINYADIPDVEIIKALVGIMPNGEYLRNYSGVSDRNFYAYTLLREETLGVGRGFTGYPGVIVRNSEVGANALSLIPFFAAVSPSGRLHTVAVRERAVLRKIHRGKYGDLAEAFQSALDAVQAVWAPLQKKLRALQSYVFADEQEAIDRLETVLKAMRVPQHFIRRCTTTYGAAKHRTHHGLALFTAVLETCATSQLDSRYDDAGVAGSVLLQLL
jgi:hypothetical protein